MKFKSILLAAAILASVLGHAQVPTTGLLKEYRFASGALTNSSTYPDPLPIGTINLTPTGSAMTTVADRGGIAGQAVSLNGDYFAAGGGPVVTTDERENMTASFWIKTGTQDANNRFLLHHYDGAQGWVAYMNNGNITLGGRFLFWRVSPAGWTGSGYHSTTTSGVNVADNQWHHIVLQTQATSSMSGNGNTYSRLDLTVWIDNVVAGSFSGIDYTLSVGTQRCNPGDLTEMLVGTSSASPQLTDQYLDAIDDIRIYRTALNTTEIGQLYNEQVNPCATPSAVALSNSTSSTVDVEWTNGGAETSWEVEAVPAGSAQGSGVVQTAGSHPYTFTGLNSNASYDFYVKADCGGGSTSGWTAPESETTACGVQTCENENFNDAVVPLCWTTTASNGGAVSVNNISGQLKMRFGPAIGSTFTAALPEMASVNGFLSFNASNSTTTATPYSFVVGTMSDPTNQATFTAFQTVLFSGNNGSTAVEVDLTSYSGSDKFIAFKYVYGNNINVHVYVDDVVFNNGSCYWDTRFVDHAAIGNNDGTSWTDAYTDLQDALFNYNGNDIWVAEGAYYPGLTRDATFSIPSGAKVYGGFDKTEVWLSQRDLANNVSRLSGDINDDDNATMLHTEATRQDNSYHVVTFKGNVQGALVNGFTISDGNANGTANNSCATPAADQSYDLRGGAIYANPYTTGDALSADVTQCVLENNTATDVAVYSAFTPCGVIGMSYNVDFDRCIIRNNYSHAFSTMMFSGASGYNLIANNSVWNSLFYGNQANSYATCLFIAASTSNGGNTNGVGGHLINNTFADNTGINDVIYYANGNNTGLKNNIIWGNGDTSPIAGSGGPTADYNLVEGGYGTNPINADPLFVDAPNGDYRLMASSPAIDAGANVYVAHGIDLAQQDRVLDGTVDVGAYEYQEIFSASVSATSICLGEGVTFSTSGGTNVSWTGGIIEGVQFFPTSTNTYTATGTSGTGMVETVDVTVTVNASLVDANVTAQSEVCSGTSATVNVSGSANGANYYLRDNSNNAVVDGPVVGTGNALTLSTGNISSSTTYNVYSESAFTNVTEEGALDFDGTNDYILAPVPSGFNYNTAYTVEAWIKSPLPGVSGGYPPIFFAGTAVGSDIEAYVQQGTDDLVLVHNRGNGGTLSYHSFPDPPNDVWYHLAIVFNGSTAEAFYNGVSQGSSSLVAPLQSANADINIGYVESAAFNVPAKFFSGQMDEYRLWSTARSSGDINSEMDNCVAATEAGLEAYYNFEDGTGAVATDVANGNNGVLTNMDNTDWVSTGSISCMGAECDLQLSQTVTIGVNTGYNLTETESVCNGDSFTFPDGTSQTITAQVVHTSNLTTVVAGCDSIIETTVVPQVCSCGSPTTAAESNLDYNRVTMSWTPISSSLTYKVRFREVGSGSWQYITISAPDTFKVKVGLTQLTDYEWQVKSVCSGGQSSYGALQTFTTPDLPCDPPSNYSTTGILDERATMNWDLVSTATAYKIRFREVGSGSWTFITELGLSKTKAGLSPATDYEWQVKVVCNGIQSSYGPLQTFTTYLVSPCPNPSTYSTTLIQGDRATLGWSTVGAATAYKVRFREVGVSTWTNIYVNASSTSKIKAGLSPLTDYEWQLRTKCSALQTAYGPMQYFTTGPTCPNPSGFSVSNILEDRATMNWSTVADAVEYKVKIRPVGGSWSYLTVTAPNTTKTRAGLNPSTDYQWRVRSVCATTRSPFASVQNFTTLPPAIPRLANPNSSDDMAFAIYPVPTSDILHIVSNSNITEIEVYTIEGKLVEAYMGNVASIDVSEISSGTYILIVKSESGIVRERFVKN